MCPLLPTSHERSFHLLSTFMVVYLLCSQDKPLPILNYTWGLFLVFSTLRVEFIFCILVFIPPVSCILQKYLKMNGCGWIKEQINNLKFTNQTQISDHFREGWKSFLFHKFFYFLGSMKEMHFFPWFYLILLESWQGNRKLDKNKVRFKWVSLLLHILHLDLHLGLWPGTNC